MTWDFTYAARIPVPKPDAPYICVLLIDDMLDVLAVFLDLIGH